MSEKTLFSTGCDISDYNDGNGGALTEEVFQYSKTNGLQAIDTPAAGTGTTKVPPRYAPTEPFNFALIRVGHGQSYDNQFESSYAICKNLGIHVGAWWYTTATATNYSDADTEINMLLNRLSGKQFEYPIFLDIEEDTLETWIDRGSAANEYRQLNDFILRWMQKLSDAGWYPGVYASASFIKNNFNSTVKNNYPMWVAAYYASSDTNPPWDKYNIPVDIFQYWGGNSDKLTLVERDRCYKDFPSIIQAAGKNGFSPSTPQDPDPEPTPIEPLNIPRKKLKLYIAHSTPAVTTLKDKSPLSIDKLEYDETEWNGSLTKKETTDDNTSSSSSSDPSSQTSGGD